METQRTAGEYITVFAVGESNDSPMVFNVPVTEAQRTAVVLTVFSVGESSD